VLLNLSNLAGEQEKALALVNGYPIKNKCYKVNIQTHLLTINEKNHFNKFHRLLSEIDSLISRAEGEAFPTGVIQDPDGVPIVTTATSTIFPDEDDKQYRKLGTALQGLRNYYRQSFFLIIQILYNKIERSLQSQKKDRVILFRMLNSLTARLSLHPLDEKTARELLATYTKNIEKYVREYNRYKYVKDKTDLGDKLIETIENFKKEFLSESE
jgi:hypothetical protein